MTLRKVLSLSIYEEALEAANKAQKDFGPEDTKSLNCGFAWVTLKPGTHWFAQYCKNYQGASKGYPSGTQIWCPGEFKGQQVDIHYAGARAFADVINRYLSDHGLQALANSRLD